MPTIITGKILSPAGTPITGAIINAFLNDFGAESASPEMYVTDVITTTTSASDGTWSLSLWSNTGSVTNTKYTFQIQTTPQSIPKEYVLDVPNVTTIKFTDLLVGYVTTQAVDLLSTEAATYDLYIDKAITYYREFYFVDARNEPINMTGFTSVLQAIDSYGTQIVNITNAVLTADGYIKLTIPASTTKTLSFDTARYDLLLGYNGNVYKVLKGNMIIRDTISLTTSL